MAWGMEKDGVILDVICPAEHEREEGSYTVPLYTTPQIKTKDEPVYWEMPDGKIVDKWGLQFYRGDTGTPLYTTPQPTQKPLMLEKFSEMKALLDDSNSLQHKTITDDELKIIMETTMPVIDWKERHGVEFNNGERNKWMLEWFIAFARSIEAAHGIKD